MSPGCRQFGIRNVSSTAKEGYEDARAMGSDILSVRQFRKLGVEAVLARIPAGVRYYVTIDIDGFDPSIAPGTGTPSHGGFLYYEVLELLAGLAKRGTVVGIDLVEVAPDYDHTGTTAILAAQVLHELHRPHHARAPVNLLENRAENCRSAVAIPLRSPEDAGHQPPRKSGSTVWRASQLIWHPCRSFASREPCKVPSRGRYRLFRRPPICRHRAAWPDRYGQLAEGHGDDVARDADRAR